MYLYFRYKQLRRNSRSRSAAALNYEIYCYFVINAFGQTCVAFTSQNFGAGRYDRCRRVLLISLVYSTTISVVLNAA